MPIRNFLLSLCLTGALGATIIQPAAVDPWASLRTAPPPEAAPDPADYPVPDLALELGQVLQFVLSWAYAGLEDPVENNAILAALQPQYEAFLNSRPYAAAPAMSAATFTVEPLPTTVSNLSSLPEPRTWLLLATGLAVVFARPLRRRK